MFRTTLMVIGLAVLVGLVTAVPAPAADPPKKPPTADEIAQAESAAQDVELLSEAFALAATGEADKAPEKYLAAYSAVKKLILLRRKQEFGKLELDKDGKPVVGQSGKTEDATNLAELAEDYYRTARELVKGQNKALAGLEALKAIIDARKFETRGALGGPKLFTRVLGPGQTHVIDIVFDTLLPGAVGFQASHPTRCKMQYGSWVHFDQVVRVGNYSWKPRPDRPIKDYKVTITNHHNFPITYKLFTN